MFTAYKIESDLVNGHSHYTSKDGTMTIAFNTDDNEWKIQPVEHRGTNIASAKNAIGDIGECPPEKAEWQYWNGSKFIAGGEDLRVKCLAYRDDVVGTCPSGSEKYGKNFCCCWN